MLSSHITMTSTGCDNLPSLSPAGPRAPDAILRITHRAVEHAGDGNLETVVAMAKASGAHMLEFDVRTTADDHPVVYHDSLIDWTGNDQRWVRDLPQSELEKRAVNIFSFERMVDAARDSN